MVYLWLNSVDPSLGRVEKATLAQQTLMELLCSQIDFPYYMYTDKELPRNLKDWKGITLDSSEAIVGIHWACFDLEGSFPIEWLPPTLQSLNVEHNHLNGTLDFKDFPAQLREINLAFNEFTGSIRLEELPPALVNLSLCANKLSGTVDLDHLPHTLEVLTLGQNNFVGSVSLRHLPGRLSRLYLRHGGFSGTVDLTSLPQGMWQLDLSENDFCGETDFSRLPPSLETLFVAHTKLSGTINGWAVDMIEANGSSVKVYQ